MLKTGRTSALLVMSGLLLGACGSGDSLSPKDRVFASISAFEASTDHLPLGETLTLTWETKNASSLQIFEGELAVELGDPSFERGSIEVQPERSLVYRLEVWGANGSFDSKEIAVTVSLPDAPKILHFGVSPEEFGVGDSVTLSWKTQGAATIHIADREGRMVELGGAAVAEGTVAVIPEASIEFELVAVGAGGKTKARTSAELIPRPEARLIAEQNPIVFGASTILRWETQGAASVRLFAEGEEALHSGEASGTHEVAPSFTKIYHLEATGAGGTTTISRRVDVQPVVEHFSTDAADAIRPGQEVALRWATLGATAATITNQAGWSFEVPASQLAAGTVLAPVGKGGLFVITARNGALSSAPRSLAVPITTEPRIVSVQVGPEGGVSAGRGERGRVALSWVVEGADRPLLLEAIPGGSINLVERSNRIDSIELNVDGPTELRLVAINEAGSHQVVVQAPVVEPPLVVSFEATPTKVGAGEATTIRWVTEDAYAVRLERDGVDLGVDPSLVSGTLDDVLLMAAGYRLYVTNALGFEVASAPLEVEVGAPLVIDFGAAVSTVQPDGMLHFRWENHGGTSLELFEGGGSEDDERLVCSSASTDEIRVGGCAVAAPSELGTLSYLLRVTNLAGGAEARTEVRITGGPVITSFAAAEQLIVDGSSLDFEWEVEAGLGGEIPSLRLVDDRGRAYDLSDAPPLGGRKAFQISGVGERDFTLIAEGTLPEDTTSAEVWVEVISLPLIAELQAAPSFVEVEGEAVEISWRTQNAVHLTVYPADAEGLRAEEPSCTITFLPEVREGSCTFRPTGLLPNAKVVVTHERGATASRDLAVGVRPARILTFQADEIDLLLGEETTLRWSTAWTDVREIGPRFMETRAPFLDLRSLQGATDFFDGLSDYQELEFPEGFRFPFFGQDWERACINSAGGIHFGSFICSSPVGAPDHFPSGRDFFGNRPFHIAPFLSHLIGRAFEDRNDPLRSLWAMVLSDPATGGRALAIQWSRIPFTTSSYQWAEVSFQVLLYEDGALEFRYGPMECRSAGTCAAQPEMESVLHGASALIGYQNPNEAQARAGEYLHLLPPMTPAVGGLQGRSFKMFPQQIQYAGFVDEAGELVIKPERTRDFTMIVKNGYSSDEETIRINVHEPGVLSSVLVEPAEPQPGMPLSLSWAGSELTSLEIVDQHGAIIYETDEPAALAAGEHLFAEGLPEGDHRFTVRVVGNIPRDVIEETVEVLVYGPYSLDSFTTDKALYLPGEPVTLSWGGSGLTRVTIESSRDPVVLPPGVDPNGGSITIHPSKLTLYTLRAESHGRLQSLQAVASIRTVQIEELSQSAEVIVPGGSAELTWNATAGGTVSITQLPVTTAAADAYQIAGMDFVEVSSNPSKRFADISTAGGTRLEAASASPWAGTIEFPEGFDFPWFGEIKTAIRVGANGFLSWNLNEGNTSYNATKYPAGNANTGNRAFLPFFQAIWTAEPGSIWWKHDASEGSLTIQWKDWQSNTQNARPSVFDFQVVLFEDGAFEYRYGAMEAAIEAYATGQTLTNIGWQNPTAKIGATLSTANQPVPNPADPSSPGPAHRSWRVEPFPSSGSVAVSPAADTEYEICVADDAWRECETRRVSVLGVGQLMFTELMVDPLGGPAGQWFEVRNLSGGAIDLRGLRIRFGTGSVTAQPIHTIGEDGDPDEPVLVERGGYKVFSAAPLMGVDAYVYGTEFELSNTVAAQRMLRLIHPTTTTIFASLTWSWTFPEGRSMEVNANRQVFGVTATPNNSVANWCESSERYGDGSQFGTPGSLGPSCLETELYRVDAYSSLPFIELEGTAANSIPALTADTGLAPLPDGMPFAFPYFEASLPAGQPLWVSANGFSQFAELLTDWPSSRSNFPTTATASQQGIAQGVVAPLWVDLLGGPGASFLHQVVSREGQQVLVLQWSGYERKNNVGRATFQTQLWENGDIVFAYRELIGGSNYWGTATNVGIEQIGSGDGHLFSQVRAQAGLGAGQSIHFRRKP